MKIQSGYALSRGAFQELLGKGFETRMARCCLRFSVVPTFDPAVVIQGKHRYLGFSRSIDLFHGAGRSPFASIREGWRKVEVNLDDAPHAYAELTMWGIIVMVSRTIARFYDSNACVAGSLSRPTLGNQLTAGLPGSWLTMRLVNPSAETIGDVLIQRGMLGYPNCRYIPVSRSDLCLVTVMATCTVIMRALSLGGG